MPDKSSLIAVDIAVAMLLSAVCKEVPEPFIKMVRQDTKTRTAEAKKGTQRTLRLYQTYNLTPDGAVASIIYTTVAVTVA